MATTTFQGVLRSAGGDSKKETRPGSAMLTVPFYIADPTAANTTRVDWSSSDTSDVILPKNAVIMQIQVSADATGGTDPTFDLGWINIDDSTDVDVDGLIAEGDADAGASVFDFATATAGDDLGTVFEDTNSVAITGGVGASAPTGGTISGYIHYFISDGGNWSS